MTKKELQYVETEGGPFVLLPLELKKKWNGSGDDDDEDSDYARAEELVSNVGVLEVGKGQALILGTAEITAFLAAKDGGVFIQAIGAQEDDVVVPAVEKALAGRTEKAVILRGDRGIILEDAVRLMTIARAAGADRLAIATTPPATR